jgi:hypothetical protein
MKLLYVAGAYRAKTIYDSSVNIRVAEAVAAELWRRGAAVICPHKNTAFLDGVTSDKNFLDGDLLMLEKCDAVIMLPGWDISKGASGEYNHALVEMLEVFEWQTQQNEINEFIGYKD